jgi:hypothetical protein
LKRGQKEEGREGEREEGLVVRRETEGERKTDRRGGGAET